MPLVNGKQPPGLRGKKHKVNGNQRASLGCQAALCEVKLIKREKKSLEMSDSGWINQSVIQGFMSLSMELPSSTSKDLCWIWENNPMYDIPLFFCCSGLSFLSFPSQFSCFPTFVLNSYQASPPQKTQKQEFVCSYCPSVHFLDWKSY